MSFLLIILFINLCSQNFPYERFRGYQQGSFHSFKIINFAGNCDGGADGGEGGEMAGDMPDGDIIDGDW